LQFLCGLFTARFQCLGLVLVFGVVGFFQFGVDLVETVLQRNEAAGFAGGRFAPLARGVLERLPVGVAQVRHGLHPCPSLGAHVLGQRCQLLAHQPFQQRRIVQIDAAIVLREQVAAGAAAYVGVGVHSDEAGQRVLCVDFALGQVLAQCGRAALPLRRAVERSFLRGVVVGDGKGHQLFQGDGSGAVVGHQARRDVGEFQAALHHQRGHAEIGGNVLDGAAFLDQRGERLELVGGVHGFALHVLGEAHGAGGRIGHQQARHVPILGDALFLRQQLQRGQPAASGHHFVMLAIGGQDDDQVLQQADARNARGEFWNGHARGLAHVALGLARQQLRQRDKNQVLGRVGHFQCGGGVGGVDFGLGHCVHGVTPDKGFAVETPPDS